jgi:LysM repeat protein
MLPDRPAVPIPHRTFTRRRFLAAAGVAGAALALEPTRLIARSLPIPPREVAAPRIVARAAHHLAWVWQFTHDGSREMIRERLAEHGLGVALKTHDGVEWMSEHDPDPWAVSGPARVEELAAFFEAGGVPFHAWCVVKGRDAVREAELAANVLDAGARSLFLDLEAHSGFWDGSSIDAIVYGNELRRRQPNSFISTSIDPRPWQIDLVPLEEFAAFSDELSPQVYWSIFSKGGHLALYAREGLAPASGTIDGAFILDAAMTRLQRFDLPIHPIGDGTRPASAGWDTFISGSYRIAAESVSTFRYGNTDDSVFALLRDTAPRPQAHTVVSGDTLGALAGRWSTTVDAVATLNGLEDPNLIVVGQQLIVPGVGRAGRTAIAGFSTGATPTLAPSRAAGTPLSTPTPTPTPSAPSPRSGSSGTYTVSPGDSLGAIAQRFGTTVQALVDANDIADPNLIYVGQELVLP